MMPACVRVGLGGAETAIVVWFVMSAFSTVEGGGVTVAVVEMEIDAETDWSCLTLTQYEWPILIPLQSCLTEGF